MSKHCFTMELYPGCEDEYQRVHDEIWPELVADTRAAGYTSYSIWRKGLTLFVYFECEDLEVTMRADSESAVGKRWATMCERLVKIEIDPRTGLPYLLPCAWDLADAV